MSEGFGTSDALDRSVLDSLKELQEEGDPDIIEEVGSLFLTHSPDKIAAIKKSTTSGDAKGLQIASHSLKSSSAYVGAMRLSAMSKSLEDMARSGSLEGASQKASVLEAEYERVKTALEAEISARRP
jgi:HPt (histidine-containing phosphotransfer) domain-containing protein